jgi:hypothetical protein
VATGKLTEKKVVMMEILLTEIGVRAIASVEALAATV